MITDNPVSWGILLIAAVSGFCYMFRMIAAADQKRYGGNHDVR